VPHPSEDDLALLALGEPAAPVADHVAGCAACSAEVRALAATVSTARSADLDALPAPPPSVWDRIVDELGIEESQAEPEPPRRSVRRLLLAGGAALTAAAAAGVVLLTGGGTPAAPPEGASAPLLALGEADATGRVVLSASPERRALLVDTAGLPPADGIYEVWLLDVETDRLVALGALDDSGSGWLTVPTGVDVSDYPQVDISLEPDDGDPTHSGNSVLRGDLPA